MAQNKDFQYIQELLQEKMRLPSDCVHANKLLVEELDRVQTGGGKGKYTEIHQDSSIRLCEKILLPVNDYPQINFVGRLIGPGGANTKALQDLTGCKLLVLGRGTMKDKKKEDELRQQGGKYAHLSEDQHVLVEVFATPEEAHIRMGNALKEIKKYLSPDFNPLAHVNGATPGNPALPLPVPAGHAPRPGLRGPRPPTGHPGMPPRPLAARPGMPPYPGMPPRPPMGARGQPPLPRGAPPPRPAPPPQPAYTLPQPAYGQQQSADPYAGLAISAADYAAAEQQPQMQEQYYGYEPSAASYDPSPYGTVATDVYGNPVQQTVGPVEHQFNEYNPVDYAAAAEQWPPSSQDNGYSQAPAAAVGLPRTAPARSQPYSIPAGRGGPRGGHAGAMRGARGGMRM